MQWDCLSRNIAMSLTYWWSEERLWLRLTFTKCSMSLTSFWSRKRCDETNFHKMCNVTHLLKRCDETGFYKICNVTHLLLVISDDIALQRNAMSLTSCWSYKKMSQGFFSQKCVCHSHAVHRRDDGDENTNEQCHSHPVAIAKVVFTNVLCHSLAVGHEKRCDSWDHLSPSCAMNSLTAFWSYKKILQ